MLRVIQNWQMKEANIPADEMFPDTFIFQDKCPRLKIPRVNQCVSSDSLLERLDGLTIRQEMNTVLSIVRYVV